MSCKCQRDKLEGKVIREQSSVINGGGLFLLRPGQLLSASSCPSFKQTNKQITNHITEKSLTEDISVQFSKITVKLNYGSKTINLNAVALCDNSHNGFCNVAKLHSSSLSFLLSFLQIQSFPLHSSTPAWTPAPSVWGTILSTFK